MRLGMKKQSSLLMLLCLGALSASFAAKEAKKPPLRFPFGLTPSSTPSHSKKILEAKGLVFQFEKSVEPQLLVSWGLTGQLDYDQFTPRQALATFDKGKLSSFSMSVGPIKECGPAQPVFVSALELVRSSYDPKESPVTAEPATDILDCGPYFKSESYNLRLENKKYVCTVIPTRDSNGYRITLTYHLRPDKPTKEEEEEKVAPQDRKHLKENL
jgi:hypothetical protein